VQGHDIAAALRVLPELAIEARTSEEQANAAMEIVAPFNDCMVGVVRFSGQTPWERHPQDELLYVLDGEVAVTVLGDEGRSEASIAKGSLFIVPAGRWHRQLPSPSVTLLFITSAQGTSHSHAEDPRVDGGERGAVSEPRS